MVDLKKRMSIRLGIVIGMQDIDPETDTVVNDHVVNVWGAVYERMEVEEAVLFQAYLNKTCGEDLDKLITKARKAASDFGMESVVGVSGDADTVSIGREIMKERGENKGRREKRDRQTENRVPGPTR